MVNIGGFGGSIPGNIDQKSLDGTQHLDSVATVLQDYIKNLTITPNVGKKDTGKPDNSGKPTLPSPDAGINTDLAQLLLKLRTETDEKQMKAAVEFIKTNKTALESKHKERVKKIIDAAKKAEKAAKAGTAGKIFGWVCVAVTVVVAIAACVATGGIAIGPCVGALMAVTMMVLQETGVMDKIMGGVTELFKKMGIKDPTAQILAAVTVTVVIIAISLAAPGGASAALGKVTKVTDGIIKVAKMASMAEKFGKAATLAQKLGTVGGAIAGAGGGVTGGISGYYQGQSLYDRADSKAIAKLIAKMQQQMEDEQDTIKDLVEQLQSGVGIVMDIMKSESETKNQINRYTSV